MDSRALHPPKQLRTKPKYEVEEGYTSFLFQFYPSLILHEHEYTLSVCKKDGKREREGEEDGWGLV